MEMSIQRLLPMTGFEPMEMDMLKTGQYYRNIFILEWTPTYVIT